ncbi:MAG: response regulator [Spirochaetia bacterium]|nr:response regulator [Spirochaetia bacterium]
MPVKDFEDLKKYKILIVEDVESILLAIKDYLMPYFIVDATDSLTNAEDLIQKSIEEKKPYDLVISDINLSDKSGLELVKIIKKKNLKTKIALITSYDINDYIEFIKNEEIDQVMTKHSNLSLHDIFVMAYKSITQDIFGIEKYFNDIKIYFPPEMKRTIEPENKEVYSVIIRSMNDKIMWTERICKILKDKKKIPISLSKLVLDEITANAMIRAPRHKDGSYKYQEIIEESDKLIPHENIVLQDEDAFILQYGFYNDWIILVCQDPHGSLSKKEILYRLYRHTALCSETGLPKGLSDTHGRGIFLLREHLTQVIFNIQKDKKTEVICLYNPVQNIPYKNISVFQI